jgi:cysteine desulfurase family protein (TIGR01976 family)
MSLMRIEPFVGGEIGTAPCLAARARELRARFPALFGPGVRLDGPAGAQVPQAVIDAVCGYLAGSNANLGSVFPESVASGRLLAQARAGAGVFLGTPDVNEVGFGLNATTVNAALVAAATKRLRPRDELLVTRLDHDANVLPWQRAAAEHGLVLRTIGLDADGRMDLAALRAALSERTRIVAFPYAANATGTVVDVAGVAGLAHEAGAIAWADLTHYAPHGPAAVHEYGVDVAVCSAYKFFGPHVGVFYARRELLAAWTGAGDARAAGLEAGTPPLESLAGLVAAFAYLEEVGWKFIGEYERSLGERFLAGLAALEGITLHGLPTMDGRTATFALTRPGIEPVHVARDLSARGIAVGAGTFHAAPLLEALGVRGGAVRLGILHYNPEDDVDAALQALAVAGRGCVTAETQ